MLVPDPAELARASRVLHRAGMRLMRLEGGVAVGLWSDLDSPEIRAALRVFGSDTLPVRYLDGPGIPMRFKLRRIPGDPVPLDVLAEMERHPQEPWTVRDRMLAPAKEQPGIRVFTIFDLLPGPGISDEHVPRNPYDLGTWGPACGRGPIGPKG